VARIPLSRGTRHCIRRFFNRHLLRAAFSRKSTLPNSGSRLPLTRVSFSLLLKVPSPLPIWALVEPPRVIITAMTEGVPFFRRFFFFEENFPGGLGPPAFFTAGFDGS